MTIKELMMQVDANRVTDAFLLMDYQFSSENEKTDIVKKYKAIPKLRKVIQENIRLFAECVPDSDTDPSTLFVLYEEDGEDYENQQKKRVDSFVIDDREVLSVIDKEFNLRQSDGKQMVSTYAYDHLPMQKLANYKVAQSSLEELGKEICAAEIFMELFYWGLYPADREREVNSLMESINAPDDEKEWISDEEFEKQMQAHKEEMWSQMSEDEKAYDIAKEHFEKETKEIVQRYWKMMNEKIEKQRIAVIRAEYEGR